MPDFSDRFMPGVLAYRLPEIELGEGLIHPNYQGGSILNLPSTLAALFDLPAIGAPALSAERFDLVRQGHRAPERIVFILMDALGFFALPEMAGGAKGAGLEPVDRRRRFSTADIDCPLYNDGGFAEPVEREEPGRTRRGRV